ncbi:MAG: hypothetical protein VB031_03020 [Eubacteriaceae bacterium]|nr:hypothetical protein [Eubacteriaceae bacterium]
MTLESTLRTVQARMYTGTMSVYAASTGTQDDETGIVDVSNPAVITNQP